MGFVDEVVITVKSGDGGRGCVSFARKRFQPKGGPDGGSGGDGGSVFVIGNASLTSLEPYIYQRQFKAENGRPGEGNDRDGRSGQDLYLEAPLGTVIIDEETGIVIGEVLEAGQRCLVALGGKGGKGNKYFATPTNRAPRYAQKGLAGQSRKIRLLLKIIADIGLVGLPNVGKSTILSAITNARPKIGEYPFTTLSPNIGVLEGEGDKKVTIADIPGLIEGASMGKGLGHKFLRHVERTKALAYVLDLSYVPKGSLIEDLEILRAELKNYDPRLLEKNQMVIINKIDLAGGFVRNYKEMEECLNSMGFVVVCISALKGVGLEQLKSALLEIML